MAGFEMLRMIPKGTKIKPRSLKLPNIWYNLFYSICIYLHVFAWVPKCMCFGKGSNQTSFDHNKGSWCLKQRFDMSHVSWCTTVVFGAQHLLSIPTHGFNFFQQAPLKLVNTCVDSHIAKLNQRLLPKNGKPNIWVKPACGLTNCKSFNSVKLKTPKEVTYRGTHSRYVPGCPAYLHPSILATNCYL